MEDAPRQRAHKQESRSTTKRSKHSPTRHNGTASKEAKPQQKIKRQHRLDSHDYEREREVDVEYESMSPRHESHHGHRQSPSRQLATPSPTHKKQRSSDRHSPTRDRHSSARQLTTPSPTHKKHRSSDKHSPTRQMTTPSPTHHRQAGADRKPERRYHSMEEPDTAPSPRRGHQRRQEAHRSVSRDEGAASARRPSSRDVTQAKQHKHSLSPHSKKYGTDNESSAQPQDATTERSRGKQSSHHSRVKRPVSTPITDELQRLRPSSRNSEPEIIRVGTPHTYVLENRTGSRGDLSRHGSRGDLSRGELSRSRGDLSRHASQQSLRDASMRSVSQSSLRSTGSMQLDESIEEWGEGRDEGRSSRSVSPANSTQSTDSNKKLMLKYMLREVRGMKHIIDPNLPDFHVTPKRGRSGTRQDHDVNLDDSQDLEGFVELEDCQGAQKRHLPDIPGSERQNRKRDVTRSTTPRDQRKQLRSFSKEEQARMLQILKE